MGTYHSVECSQLLPYREPQLKLQLYSTYPATRPEFIHQEIYQLKVVSIQPGSVECRLTAQKQPPYDCYQHNIKENIRICFIVNQKCIFQKQAVFTSELSPYDVSGAQQLDVPKSNRFKKQWYMEMVKYSYSISWSNILMVGTQA